MNEESKKKIISLAVMRVGFQFKWTRTRRVKKIMRAEFHKRNAPELEHCVRNYGQNWALKWKAMINRCETLPTGRCQWQWNECYRHNSKAIDKWHYTLSHRFQGKNYALLFSIVLFLIGDTDSALIFACRNFIYEQMPQIAISHMHPFCPSVFGFSSISYALK